MSEEKKENGQDEQVAQDPLAGISRDELKNHPMVSGILTQLKQATEKLTEYEQAKEQAELERKKTAAEAKGDYEKALAEIQAAKDAEIAKAMAQVEAIKAEALNAKLSAEVAKMGVDNPVIAEGVKAMFRSQSDIEDPSEWAKTFVESEYFQSLAQAKQTQPQQRSATSGTRAGSGDLAQRLVDKSAQVRARARDELADLYGRNRAEAERIQAESVRLARG